MKWSIPPRIKIYEALGALGDRRVHVEGNSAKVFSSSGKKFYTVHFDPAQKAIMSNDNGSYWQGYLGYPAIAFLLFKGVIAYENSLATALAGIAWKDINVKFKNDFKKTEIFALQKLARSGIDERDVKNSIDKILDEIKGLELNYLGMKIKPPSGY